MTYARNQSTRQISIQIMLALLLTVLTAFLSFSAELVYTIQIGSHQVEQRAKRQYAAVLNLLPEEEREDLRIENIDQYYALRLGSFKTYREAKARLRSVKPTYRDATVITAYISRNLLVKIYRAEPTAAAGPTLLEQQEPPVTELQVKPEATSARGFDATGHQPPITEPQVKPEETAPVKAEVPVPAQVEQTDEPVLVAEQSQPAPALVAVVEPVAAASVAIKPLETTAADTNPVHSAVAKNRPAAAAEAQNFFPSTLRLMLAAVLSLCILALTVRALKAAKTAQLSKTATKNTEPAAKAVEKSASEPLPATALADAATIALDEPAATGFMVGSTQTAWLNESSGDDKKAAAAVEVMPDPDQAAAETGAQGHEERPTDQSETPPGRAATDLPSFAGHKNLQERIVAEAETGAQGFEERPTDQSETPPESAATDLPSFAGHENLQERIVKEKRENRISSALEAAIFAAKRKN